MTDKTMTLLEMADDLQYVIDGERPRLNKSEMRDYVRSLRHLSHPAERGETVAKEEYRQCNWSEDHPDACPYCAGEACSKCGAGCWSNRSDCAHDSLERHELPNTAQPPAAGVPDGWNDALIEARKRIHAMALSNGWNTDSDAYAVSCLLEDMLYATPSPTIDVAAVREVISDLRMEAIYESRGYLLEHADKLARAIGDAK